MKVQAVHRTVRIWPDNDRRVKQEVKKRKLKRGYSQIVNEFIKKHGLDNENT